MQCISKTLPLVIFLLCALPALATKQVPTLLIYKGDTMPMYEDPLEAWFRKMGNRKIPGLDSAWNTACWSGYYTIWEIKNDSLFLRRIATCSFGHSNDRSGDGDLIAMFGKEDVHAWWYTGKIITPKNDMGSLYMNHHSRKKVFFIDRGELFAYKTQPYRKVSGDIGKLRDKKTMSAETVLSRLSDNKAPVCSGVYNLKYNSKGRLKKVSASPGLTKKVIGKKQSKSCVKTVKEMLHKNNAAQLDNEGKQKLIMKIAEGAIATW